MDKIFEQLQFFRGFTLSNLQKLEKEHADIQPTGFSNTLRWNYGHILTAYEGLVFQLAGKESKLDPKYMQLFSQGTRPSEWTTDAPSLEEIAGELDKHGKLIVETFQNSLDEKLLQPFVVSGEHKLETVRDALIFCIWHEGLHQGVINGLTRVVTTK
ncbi:MULTISPECIES: DinB family protein [unclassified Bacillus (in: firmicutes)]|uniref:DinB family protein n=1 Tax=unclassified Bacillus (in: firmicutes) TaxID=185979 RepID=UPI0008EBDB7B|nr:MULTISPECIES: DinB family protein [unclassified Bacillus (in: firmicutes)]SFB19670.1 DinB superfamily protein [Bacillus sp. UNCCL13]SFQ90715.1 DinB superfamily protein [Bacillus sp. cl95]